ncbi:hypothetical protein UA75_13910 [Actinoalloteichus sp. GBA129-24]|uniref:Uncharacterized protein n=1 Tax=Actinoalloteichus fjordicus TaxID=1612552 RepID=A0AAC9LBE2_9PSEU|nr:hypothetical protein UA74_13825 [Actinoalloteichus fjordicus]APU20792.1 hypothetical protein UA75_13910 [Actinoalloteichus sp. GBA129-24]
MIGLLLGGPAGARRTRASAPKTERVGGGAAGGRLADGAALPTESVSHRPTRRRVTAAGWDDRRRGRLLRKRVAVDHGDPPGRHRSDCVDLESTHSRRRIVDCGCRRPAADSHRDHRRTSTTPVDPFLSHLMSTFRGTVSRIHCRRIIVDINTRGEWRPISSDRIPDSSAATSAGDQRRRRPTCLLPRGPYGPAAMWSAPTVDSPGISPSGPSRRPRAPARCPQGTARPG